MSRYEYDAEASERLHMDVVHELADDQPVPVSRWVEAMRRLNGIDDPLARKLLVVHRGCGSGNGVCDSSQEETTPIARRFDWPCETTQVIADHFSVQYPAPPGRNGT